MRELRRRVRRVGAHEDMARADNSEHEDRVVYRVEGMEAYCASRLEIEGMEAGDEFPD
jgi:hypothetical protein